VDSFQLEPQESFDSDLSIEGVNTLSDAVPGELSFFTNAKYRKDLMTTRATAVLLEKPVEGCPAIQLVDPNPYAVLARILQKMYPEERMAPGIHPSAVIAEDVTLAGGCYIGPNCTLSEGVSVGNGTILHGNCFIGKNSSIGEDCTLFPSVTLYHGVTLGHRVRIHANTVIGSDGFGFAQDQGRHIKIPQLGGVRIEDDVEIGSNTSIDRGAQSPTIIGKGTKIDNLVQVAHGVEIGEHCILAGQTGISGSSVIGDHCVFAGRAGLVGHVEIARNVVIMAQSTATKSIRKSGYYAGFPAREVSQYHREIASVRRIDAMRKKIRELEQCLK
jgi:UDP-3-O-[3-hydroxymyristoyl] glucosamine N-acyltransferase